MLGTILFLFAVLAYLLSSDKLQSRRTALWKQRWSWCYNTAVKHFFSAKTMLCTWCSHPPNPHSVSKRWRRETWGAWGGLTLRSGGEHNPSMWGGLLQSQICVKAWEPCSVTFYQKSRRVHGKLIPDLVAIGKLGMYHTDCYFFSIFS